ncbi:DUF58 domain-containing protein [Algibacillus agarilyticus]|uniref:DUF58 domain-containing protein n=1 Tax=Algibacillus agarilyticus TaxID=2234133 RepID=UPI000DCFFB58|nr:DUF58 domain-containing protein [Algibacillus agarilyticus]
MTHSRWLSKWLDKRLPPQRQCKLDHSNIFILPSKAGVAVILVTLAIYLLGTNYANNLVLLLAYVSTAILISAIFYSFLNVAHLTIQVEKTPPVFLSNVCLQTFRIINERPSWAIEFLHHDGKVQFDLPYVDTHLIKMPFVPPHRGWCLPERIRVQTQAPFMLFTVWSLPHFNIKQLVYPKPIECPQWLTGTGLSQEEGQSNDIQNAEDFYGLREYVETDSLKHVAWKQLAKGKGWLTKQFAAPNQPERWFSYYIVHDNDHELTISHLTWLVLQTKNEDITFGLELPHASLGPNAGPIFIEECLLALAEMP